jgi:hypothetical protein
LYLSPAQCIGWKPVVFIEPPEAMDMMTVLSVCVIPKGSDFDFGAVAGGRLAILQLNDALDVHVVATHHKDTTWASLEPVRRSLAVDAEYAATMRQHPGGVLLAHGVGDDGVRFLLPYPSRNLVSPSTAS